MTVTLFLLVLLSLGLLGALGLFINLKRDLISRSLQERDRVEAILARLLEAESRMTLPPPPAAEPEHVVPRLALNSGMNLSKRVQVMRMLRQGDEIGHIAAVLGLSRGEVQILASIHTEGVGTLRTAATVE